MFRVYTQSTKANFGNPKIAAHGDDLDSMLDSAFDLISKENPKNRNRVWIETENGKILPLMN